MRELNFSNVNLFELFFHTKSPLKHLAPVVDQVHINDFHATLLHLFGLNHLKLARRFGGFDIRLTNVGGRVVEKVFTG